MRKTFLPVLLLSSTLAFGQAFPPDTDKDVAVGFGSGVLTNVCAAADVTLTTVGTSEEILATCTIPADTFPANFTGFDVIATYIGAANANSKTMNVRIDGIAGDIVLEVTGDTDSADSYEMMGTMTVGNGAGGILSGTGTTTQGTGASTTERMRVTGLTFSGDIDIVFTGLTAAGAGDVTLTSYILRMFTNVVGESGGHYNGGSVDSPFLAPDGIPGAPGVAFTDDTDTGMYRIGANDLGFATNSSLKFQIDNNGITSVLGPVYSISGFETLPAFSFTGDTDTGIWRSGADVVSVTAGGAAGSTTNFNATNTTFEFPLLVPNGALTAPSYSFTTDSESGMGYFSSGPFVQNQASSTIDGRTYTLWQDGNWATTQWYDAVPNTTSNIRMVDAGTDEPRFEASATTGTGNHFDFEASTLGAEPKFMFTLNDGGAGNVDVLTMIDTSATFATPVLVPNGAGSAPALSFTSDTDAGLWGNGSDTVTLQSEAAGTGGRGWLELGPAAFRLKGDSNFDLTDYVEITHATVGGQVLTLTSTDTTNADTSRIELTNANPADVIIFASETGQSSTTTFGTTSTTFSDLVHLDGDLQFEGATPDAFETTLTVVDPTTPSKTITLPDLTGTVLLGGAVNTPAATTLNASGDLVFTTDTAAHVLRVDSFGVDIVSDAGFNLDITDGGDVLDMHFNVLGAPSINIELDNGTNSNELAFSATTLTINGDSDNNGTGNIVVIGGDISITEDDQGGNSTALVFETAVGARTITFPTATGTAEVRPKGTTALTDATATAFAQIAIPQTIGSNFAQGTVHYEIYCDDATNQAQRMGRVDFVCHNLAGTETCAFSTPVEHSLGDGTAVVAAASFDNTSATDTVDLRANSDCTGVTPTTLDMYWEIDQQKYSVVTPQ